MVIIKKILDMKKFKFIIALGLVVSLASCSNYLDINNNPNAPAQTVPDPVLAGALVETARIYSQDVTQFSAPWVGYWSFSGTYSSAGAVGENYKLLNTSYQNVWNDIYLNLSNYTLVESQTSTAGNEFYKAIAQIMKVYGFHTLVDCYNDVAYTNALQGFKNLNPTYDAAQGVYTDLISKLDDAVTNIKAAQAVSTTKVVPKTTDIMFGGDMNKWIKLANTMRLRLLLRQSGIGSQASYISGEIAKLVSDGAQFLGAGEDAQINPGYTKANGQQNPFWEMSGLGVGGDIGGRDYFRTSAYSLSFFKNNGDPRVDFFFRTPDSAPGTNSGTKPYFSIPWGTPPTTNYVSAVTSGFGIGVLPGPSAPVTFLSAAESMFLQAEAAQRGWLGAGNQQSLFQAGITESFRLLGVTSDPAKYYTNGLVNCDWSASTDKLQAIIVQKWAANCSINTMESWCDLRRTGYPNDLPVTGDPTHVGPGTPPVRLLYPQTEYNVNSNAVSGYTIDPFASKVFWQP
jgi:hypothetical protein